MAEATFKMAVRETGNPAGRAVVLLHGFPVDGAMWDAQAAALAAAGFRAIVPDLRGFGKSTAAPTAGMDEMAADVVALLDGLGLDRVAVAGFSMGGYVALELAHRHPARVAALILVDTRAEPDAPEAAAGRRTRIAQIEASHSLEGLCDAMMPGFLSAVTRNTRPDVVAAARAMMLRQDPAAVTAALAGLAQRADQRPRLAGISCPALVVWGKDDEITPHASQGVFLASLKGSRLVTVNAAHASPLEAPEAVGTAMVEFLRGLA